MLSVVLVEPETPGNIGSVARVMKNFGLSSLVIVNPKCNYLDGEAYGRAMHARAILKSAMVVSGFSSLERYDCIVGTTSRLGTDYNVIRSPISPENLSSMLERFKRPNVALVFGREGTGLLTKEISKCDILVTIPSSVRYPVLNLSHAVAIILYELFKSSNSEKVGSRIAPAGRREKLVALSMVNEILGEMDYALDSRKGTQSLVMRRLVNKSFMTQREMFAFLGFLRKILVLIRAKR